MRLDGSHGIEQEQYPAGPIDWVLRVAENRPQTIPTSDSLPYQCEPGVDPAPRRGWCRPRPHHRHAFDKLLDGFGARRCHEWDCDRQRFGFLQHFVWWNQTARGKYDFLRQFRRIGAFDRLFISRELVLENWLGDD